VEGAGHGRQHGAAGGAHGFRVRPVAAGVHVVDDESVLVALSLRIDPTERAREDAA
jgi:hypothetical protein